MHDRGRTRRQDCQLVTCRRRVAGPLGKHVGGCTRRLLGLLDGLANPLRTARPGRTTRPVGQPLRDIVGGRRPRQPARPDGCGPAETSPASARDRVRRIEPQASLTALETADGLIAWSGVVGSAPAVSLARAPGPPARRRTRARPGPAPGRCRPRAAPSWPLPPASARSARRTETAPASARRGLPGPDSA